MRAWMARPTSASLMRAEFTPHSRWPSDYRRAGECEFVLGIPAPRRVRQVGPTTDEVDHDMEDLPAGSVDCGSADRHADRFQSPEWTPPTRNDQRSGPERIALSKLYEGLLNATHFL